MNLLIIHLYRNSPNPYTNPPNTDTNPNPQVCAPRWRNQLHRSSYLMNGVCYIVDDELQTAEKRIPLTKASE